MNWLPRNLPRDLSKSLNVSGPPRRRGPRPRLARDGCKTPWKGEGPHREKTLFISLAPDVPSTCIIKPLAAAEENAGCSVFPAARLASWEVAL